MTYVVLDTLTSTMVGEFAEEEAAIQFTYEAADLVNDTCQTFDIYEVIEPQQWLLDNLAQEVAVPTQTIAVGGEQ